MKEQIEKRNCKECLHFEACCKWTDFPKQLGFPVCRKYRKQSEGEWTRVEVNGKNYGQVYYQHKECELNATQLFPSPYHFCPNCGAKMKGGAE